MDATNSVFLDNAGVEKGTTVLAFDGTSKVTTTKLLAGRTYHFFTKSLCYIRMSSVNTVLATASSEAIPPNQVIVKTIPGNTDLYVSAIQDDTPGNLLMTLMDGLGR
jgi:hypothetical protein